MEDNPAWETKSHSANQEIPRLYGTEGSLPCSPYPEPLASSPQLPTLFPYDPF